MATPTPPWLDSSGANCLRLADHIILVVGKYVFHRYEEAEVRKRLEEKDRQELQKKQEPKDDGKSSAKSSSESTADSKGKSQKVIEDVSEFSIQSKGIVLILHVIFISSCFQFRIFFCCLVLFLKLLYIPHNLLSLLWKR